MNNINLSVYNSNFRIKPNCNFEHTHPHRKDKTNVNCNLKQKATVLAGAAFGVLGAVYLLSKGQSAKLGKHVSMLNVKYEEKEILALGTTSVAAGTLTGIIADNKKHRTAKIREGLHQTIANILFPMVFISAGNKLFDKVKPAIAKHLPKLPQNTFIGKTLTILPNLAISAAGLVAGVFIGTKAANTINSKIFTSDKKRKIKPQDFGYHPDDILMSFSVADKKGYMQKLLGKVFPPVFTICGYEAGIKR